MSDTASPRKIKVLFAINELLVGGAQNMLVEQVNAIDPARFDPYVATVREYSAPHLREKLRLPPEKYIAFTFKGPFDIRSWLSLIAFLRREKFDAVITNLFFANFIVRAAAIVAGVKTMLAYEHNIYRDKSAFQIVIDRLLAKATFRILTGAPQVRAFTIAQESLPEGKVVVVYDAADLDFAHVKEARGRVLEKYSLQNEALYIVACGWLIEQKGHEYFIDAARIALDARMDGERDLQFLIFGDGALREDLARRIKDAGLEGQVRLLGVAPIADILAISDVFSLISLWEGFSIALIQAMNAGCAIVASKVSGSEEAIQDGASGLLVPPADADAAAKAFMRLAGDPQMRSALGAAAQERSQAYDMKHQIREIERLILSGLNLP